MKQASPERRGNSVVLMVVSLGLAITGWVYVQAERATQDTRNNLQVQVKGLSEDMVVMPKPEMMPRVDIELEGSAEDLRKVDDTSVVPYVNLAGLDTGTHRVPVRVDTRGIPLNVRYTLRRPFIEVEIEPLWRKTQEVTVDQFGSPPPGFQVVALEAQPDSVELSGARVDVNRVRTAQVKYDLSKAQTEQAQELPIQLFDEKLIPVEDVKAYPPTVTVRAAVAAAPAVKALPIQPTWTGQLPVGFKLERYELRPAQARVTADNALLAKMSVIETLPVDLTGIRGTREVRTKIRLPKGFTAVSGDTVSVKVYVVPAPQPNVESPPVQNPPPKSMPR